MIVVTVEKLLHWAFVLEMPTPDQGAEMAVGGFGPWGAVDRFGQLGVMVDENRIMGWADGGMSWVVGEAHPDAVKVVNAVADLDLRVVTEEGCHDILAGWAGLGVLGEQAVAKAWGLVSAPAGDGRLALKSPLSALVRRVAVLESWPLWQCDAPRIEVAKTRGKPAWFRKVAQEVEWNASGKAIGWVEVEVDGYDARQKRPYPGAYRKHVLVPDVSGALARRIEYSLTHAALTALAEDLDGLGGRKVLPPMRSSMPWADATMVDIEIVGEGD